MRILKTVGKISLSVLILYLVFQKISWNTTLGILREANWGWLLGAAIMFALSKWVAAFRLQFFFRAISVFISNKVNLRLYWLGMYYNLFLPGGIGGDGYKIYLLQKRFQPGVKPLFWALLTDRLSGVAALGVLVLGGLSVLPLPSPLFFWSFLLIPVGLAMYYLFLKIIVKRFTAIFGITLGYAIVVQFAQTIAAIFILIALGQTDTSLWLGYIVLFLISSIAAALPLTIGGAGAREITFLYGASLLELNEERAVALSLLFYIISALISLIGAYFSFRQAGLKGLQDSGENAGQLGIEVGQNIAL